MRILDAMKSVVLAFVAPVIITVLMAAIMLASIGVLVASPVLLLYLGSRNSGDQR